MHQTLANKSTRSGHREPWGNIHPGRPYLARLQEWRSGVAVGPSPDAAGRSIGGFGRVERASAPRDILGRAVRDGLASVALVLLAFVVVLMPAIQRSSASASQRHRAGHRRSLACGASDCARLSMKAWIEHEDALVTVRSEYDEEDDEESCSATRQAYETYDSSLSPSRSAPAWNLAVPSCLSASRPLRC